MTFKLKTLTTSALLSALALTGQTASAHPSFVNGGNPNGINWKNNTPTFSSSCKQDPITLRWNCEDMVMGSVRGYMEDAIRIGHGCDIQDTGSNVDPVVANSWLWPTGKGGTGNWSKAPMSTGCSASGNTCTGSATQPAVARIPDSSKKPNLNNAPNPDGMGTATTLASELIEGTTTGAPGSPEVPISTLNPPGGQPRFQFAGNVGYFKTNVARAPNMNYGGGFYAKGNKFDAAQIAALGIGSAGAPYHNAFQALYAVDQNTSSIRKLAFSSTSCARKLVVRPAGADLCELHAERSAYNNNPHIGNFWFGGPTNQFKDGHGIHENFWLQYTLLVRDPAVNPYPATCKDQAKGDYDLVVMPSIAEIDTYLKFPGFATKP
jgi:hypothetical protein